MRWLSNRHATKVSCIAIVAALGMVDAPAWAGDGGETSIDLASPVFAAIESTGARALRDDEMGELRGGFLGGLGGILDALPETNTVVIQDGQDTVSASGPGFVSVTRSRPGFSATATANSSSSSGSSSFSGSLFRFD